MIKWLIASAILLFLWLVCKIWSALIDIAIQLEELNKNIRR